MDLPNLDDILNDTIETVKPKRVTTTPQEGGVLPTKELPKSSVGMPSIISNNLNGTPAPALDTILSQGQEPQLTKLQKAGKDFKGGLDATLRGAVPLLTAEFISTPLVGAINNLLGTNIEKPADAMRAMFEKVGVEAPSNKTEQLVELLSTVTIGAMTSIAGGLGMQGKLPKIDPLKNMQQVNTSPWLSVDDAVTPLKNIAPSASKNVAASLAANPGRNLTGAITGTLASAGTDELLDKTNMNEGLKTGISVVTGIATDVITQGLMGQIQKKVPALANKLLENVPLSAKEKDIIKTLTAQNGLEPTATEVHNITRPGNKKRVNTMASRTGGGDDAGQIYYDRTSEMENKILTLLDDADIPLDGKTLSKEASGDTMLKEFTKKRGEEVTDLVNLKKDITASFDGGAQVDTSKVRAYMEELATEYMDDSDLKPLGIKLANWSKELEAKSFAQIEDKRSLIGATLSGDMFKDMGSIPAKVKKKVYAGVKKAQLEYIKKNGTPSDLSKWKLANGKLKLMIEDFNDKSVSQVMDEAYNTPRNQTPEVMVNTLLNGEPSTVKKMLKRQTPKGRAVAEEYILFDAVKDLDAEKLSGKAFNKMVRDKGEKLGIVIGQENLDVFNSARKYFKYANPSAEFVDGFNGGASRTSGVAKILGPNMQLRAGLSKVTGPIYDNYAKWAERPAVRDLLLKMERLPEGNPKWEEFAKALTRLNANITSFETNKARAQAEKQERNTPKEQ